MSETAAQRAHRIEGELDAARTRQGLVAGAEQAIARLEDELAAANAAVVAESKPKPKPKPKKKTASKASSKSTTKPKSKK